MKFARRAFLSATLGAALCVALPATAQQLGTDYTLLSPPQPTENPAKIEVTEFFSYGCSHCAEFNPLLAAWAVRLAPDVSFRKVPVSFGRAAWMNIGKLYYTLEGMGDAARLDADIFRAIHSERVNLFDERNQVAWLANKGVDTKKYSELFNSFGMMSKIKRADQMTQSYRIEGVPALVVDGKYLVAGKDFNDQLAIADKLIAKIRTEKLTKGAGKK